MVLVAVASFVYANNDVAKARVGGETLVIYGDIRGWKVLLPTGVDFG